MTIHKRLPSLLYVGDVPVAQTRFGEIQLFRLLQNYPRDSLRIIEPSYARAEPADRLPSVHYGCIQLGPARLFHTRFAHHLGAMAFAAAEFAASNVIRQLASFRPRAVLTTLHDYSWRLAAAVARRMNVPLHVVIHDDPVEKFSVRPLFGPWYLREVAKLCRQAACCYCISPQMAERYRERFGAVAELLYPIRSKDAVSFPNIAPQVARRPRKIVFAGSLYVESYWDILLRVAAAAAVAGMELHIYTDIGPDLRSKYRDSAENLFIHPAIAKGQFENVLRKEADVLLLAVPFAESFREFASTGFPSKLADYMAVGVPILLAAPAYASVTCWAQKHADSVLAVNGDTAETYTDALESLAAQPLLRARLAEQAQEVCRREFSFVPATQIFFENLFRAAA